MSAGDSTPLSLDEVHAHVAQRLLAGEHRYTAGRRVLIEALATAPRPLTLPDIVSRSEIAASSAYRNLDVLEQCGAIRRLTVGNDHAHFELAEPLLDHHHHLVCIGCGSIEDIHLSEDVERLVDESLTSAARRLGFTPAYHSLDLHGHCAACGA